MPAAPAGYAVERERGAWVVALPSVMAAVRAAVAEHETLYVAASRAPAAESFAGRGAAYRLEADGEDWLVRHYRRGGAVARVLQDEYLRLGEPRPLRELRASTAARARGVATPEVVAAVIYEAGIVYRADLATRFVADSTDLARLTFGGAGEGVLDGWRAAGGLLRHAFAAGVEHADLNLMNVLVRNGAAEAWLLDLDRAVVHDHGVSDVARRRMLDRFARSRRKLEAHHGRRVDERALAAFDAALRGGHG